MTDIPWNERLERVRNQLGWSYAKLGEFFGVTDVAALYWCKGTNRVPESVKGHIPLLEEASRRKQEEELMGLVKIGIAGFGLWALVNLFSGEDNDD